MTNKKPKKISIEYDVYDEKGNIAPGGMTLTVTKAFPPDFYIDLQEEILREKEPVFLCPGASWKDVSITLVANDMVSVKTPQGEGRFTYHDLGMQNKRKGDKPNALWALFKLFAKHKGYITRQNIEYDRRLPDTAKRLDNHLKRIFKINERIYTGNYKQEKGYRTRIEFNDRTHR